MRHRLGIAVYPLVIAAAATVFSLSPACEGKELSEKNCSNQIDDDDDGLVDCLDPDCAGRAECQGCGNGIKNDDEACDGEDFGNEFCETLGFVGGYLMCNPDCTIDTTLCVSPVCGDSLAQGSEECDGYDMGDAASCVEQGFLGGVVHCDNETCTYDTSECFNEVVCDDVTATSPQTPWCYGAPTSFGYGWTHYEWLDFDDGHDYQLQLELWGTSSGPFPTGTYDLAAAPNDNYSTCLVCPLLIQCADPNCVYAGRTFLPQAGTYEVLEAALANAGSFRGVLRDLEWKEVDIDWEDTYDSTPVPAGPCIVPDAAITLDSSVIQPP